MNAKLVKYLVGIVSVGLGALLSGCFDVVPMTTVHPVTQEGADIMTVYKITTWISVAIFFAVSIPICIALYRFREKPGDESIPEQVHGNAFLEFLWTVIPVVLLLIIAIPTWQVIFKQAKPFPEGQSLKVEVIGHQWWWEFRYPELGIVTANELHLPENTNITLDLTSADVIHSFWVPRFGGKVDTVPGHNNPMYWVTPTASDTPGGDYYQGQCVELCGLSHALMRFQAVIHKKDEFDRWAKTYNEPPKVVTSLEKKGDQIFHTICQACHAISGTASAQIPGPKIGPDLSNFGNRRTLGAGTLENNQENLFKWVKDSTSVKPGSLMGNLGLDDESVRAVNAYIRNSTVKVY